MRTTRGSAASATRPRTTRPAPGAERRQVRADLEKAFGSSAGAGPDRAAIDSRRLAIIPAPRRGSGADARRQRRRAQPTSTAAPRSQPEGDLAGHRLRLLGGVSYALAAGYIDADDLQASSPAGANPGGKWVTIYANEDHAFMVVAGLRFDTSGGSAPHAGSRRRPQLRGLRSATRRASRHGRSRFCRACSRRDLEGIAAAGPIPLTVRAPGPDRRSAADRLPFLFGFSPGRADHGRDRRRADRAAGGDEHRLAPVACRRHPPLAHAFIDVFVAVALIASPFCSASPTRARRPACSSGSAWPTCCSRSARAAARRARRPAARGAHEPPAAGAQPTA